MMSRHSRELHVLLAPARGTRSPVLRLARADDISVRVAVKLQSSAADHLSGILKIPIAPRFHFDSCRYGLLHSTVRMREGGGVQSTSVGTPSPGAYRLTHWNAFRAFFLWMYELRSSVIDTNNDAACIPAGRGQSTSSDGMQRTLLTHQLR